MRLGETHKLSKRVAIVTGAAQGLGAAIASALVEVGARVVMADVCGERLQRSALEVDSEGQWVVPRIVDVTQPEEVEQLVEATLGMWDRVDILVNCAGILRTTRVDVITKQEWDSVLDVNLNGTFSCSLAVLPAMRAQGWGRIVNISSSAGRSVSTLGGIHYTASKAGVLGLTRGMAKETAPWGITVNAICPGLIDTEMAQSHASETELDDYAGSFPMRRLGTAAEIAAAVIFLTAEATYVTGAALDINGGDLML